MEGRKKFMFIPMASPGYLYPSIRLAHVLEDQGHTVRFAAAQEYEVTLQNQGFDTIGIRNDGLPFLHPSAWFVADHAIPEFRVLDQLLRNFSPDFIVTNPLVMAAFILAETSGIPLINVGFAEYLFPGVQKVNPGKEWRLRSMTGFLNGYRLAVGLPVIEPDATNSPLIGTRYLLRSSPEMYTDEDLPSQVRHVGDLYWEPPYQNRRLQQFIQSQKAKGNKLVYVQIGRLFEDGTLFAKLIEFFSKLQLGFVVDIGRADYLQQPLVAPSNCFFSGFIPLGACEKDISGVICTGQSTTVVSAILHKKPVLCLPHSADAQEFTLRMVTKGIARGIMGEDKWQLSVLQAQLNEMLLRPAPAEMGFYRDTLLRYDDELIYQQVKDGLF